MTKYDYKSIEKKWHEKWEKDGIYEASNTSKKPKKYVLIEFPYPSGEGLHMGHLRPYTAGDTYSRYWRMKGFETLYPMGWDAFGLPAENYALKNKVHPRVSTAKNIENAKRQLKSWGMGFDWSREVNTTDPGYYKWTQWIFLQFFKAGLAYEATGLINWCPKDKTGLANEEVVDGKCERCGTVVEKKEMRQWYLKITAYAEQLLEGLKDLAWPEPVKLQQENWIGKSEGAEIEFPISNQYNYVILHGWKENLTTRFYPWLKEQLEIRGARVTIPKLPNTSGPKEEEQVAYVLENCHFDENTILVGHSLGSVVAMKVIEKLKTPIAGLITVGGFASPNFKDHPRLFEKNFIWNFDFDGIRKKTGFIIVLHDPNDDAVSDEQAAELGRAFKVSVRRQAGEEPHFRATQEPAVFDACLPTIKIFTTRPDTLFGATYMILAPEHPLVKNLESGILNPEEVKKYVEKAKKKTDLQRTMVEKEKTGVELKGITAINPATKEKIPVWIADFVFGGYGTGAVFADAHDERDFEFAKRYNILLKTTLRPKDGSDDSKIRSLEVCFTEKGILYDSGEFSGLTSEEAIPKMAAAFGKIVTQYKLRDWVFSRQRYWGEPIPLIHCEKCGIVPVPDNDLPVTLPEVKDYEPTGTGESPLSAISEWVNVKCPNCGGSAKRETNTMPQWAGSSWYWLRYTDPHNEKEFASKKLLKHWQPVDVYFGGMEHTTLHLLYSRFWNLFLHDRGLVTEKEPFLRRVPHGIVLAADGEKMSKSRGNVVNPDEIVEKFGADVMRMYEMFLGPHGDTVSWNDKGIMGVKRFLDKAWRVTPSLNRLSAAGEVGNFSPQGGGKSIHMLIKKVTTDIEAFKFNTAIAAFMEFLNKHENLSKHDWEIFLRLLAPFAPHLTEELWHQLGHKKSIHLEKWPEYDESLVKDENVTIVVQVLGKLRASFDMPAGSSQKEIKEKALSDENVKKYLEGKEILKEIFVADKLINFVVK